MSTNVPIVVHVRRNSDGAVSLYPFPEYGWEDDDDDFMWAEGNYACDCNRALFFARGGGKPDGDSDECGGDKFSVRIYDLEGKLRYFDGEWPDD